MRNQKLFALLLIVLSSWSVTNTNASNKAPRAIVDDTEKLSYAIQDDLSSFDSDENQASSIVSESSSLSEEHSLKKRTDGRSLHDIAELGKSIEKISFGENTKSPQTILMTSSLIIIVSLSLSFEPAIQS